MPSKTYLILENIKINYFNILYALIMPAFIVGQFIFKSIFILIIISALIRFKFKVFYFNKNFINLLFIITILYFCFNVLVISISYYELNTRYLFFLFILIFYFVTNYLLLNNNINWIKIFYLNIIILLFVYFDTFIQIIYLKDLFGYLYYQAYDRFSGPFGEEFILGGFMSFYLVSSLLIYFKGSKKNKFTTPFIFIFFLISIYFSIKSGERIAFLTIVLQIFLIPIIFQKINKIKFFQLSLLTITFLSLLVISDETVKKKYLHFYSLVFDYNSKYTVNKNNLNNDQRKVNKIGFLNNQTGAHFLTGIEIWKNFPIFGVGIKNFRKESSDEKYSDIISYHAKFRNATHPHNHQIELLSETGIIGFFLYNIFILILLFKILKTKFIFKKNDYFLDVFLVIILSKYFPFKSDASLFSSSMGLLYWMYVIFLLSSFNKLALNYKKAD